MVFCFLARTENLTSGEKLQRNVCGMGIIMNGEERREKLVELLKNTESPLSGTRLSRLLHVSRQVIVNDIALLRAANVDILSTNRGYLLSVPVSSTRILNVKCRPLLMQAAKYRTLSLNTLYTAEFPHRLKYIPEMIL